MSTTLSRLSTRRGATADRGAPGAGEPSSFKACAVHWRAGDHAMSQNGVVLLTTHLVRDHPILLHCNKNKKFFSIVFTIHIMLHCNITTRWGCR